jgi:Glycosyl hydrolase family 46
VLLRVANIDPATLNPWASHRSESAGLWNRQTLPRTVMKREAAHTDTSRVDTAQRVFLRNGNLDLSLPLFWQVYGDTYYIAS